MAFVLSWVSELDQFAQPVHLFLFFPAFLCLLRCFMRMSSDLFASAIYRIRLSTVVPFNIYRCFIERYSAIFLLLCRCPGGVKIEVNGAVIAFAIAPARALTGLIVVFSIRHQTIFRIYMSTCHVLWYAQRFGSLKRRA